MNTISRILLLAACALGSACSVNPVTGESELSLVSEAQEIALGEQQYAPSQQSQGGQYVVDPQLQSYVADIGHRLAAVSHRPGLPYDFVVLNNSVPNAWALPGGKIAVNRGLLIKLQDEAELAAVLSHEIVHAAARHGASQMSRGALTGITAQIATIAAASAGYGQLGSRAAQASSAAFMARYGRDDELESDKYGMEYMAKLGYDPQAAVSLQETFVRLSAKRQQDFVSGLFASHPPSQARVDANRERAKTLSDGERYRQRYQRHIAQLQKDAEAYTKQDQAVAALKQDDAHKALALLDAAVAIQPEEAQFWETRGHAWSMLDNTANAEKAYTTAIRKNPGYFSPKLYRGLSYLQSEQWTAARQDLFDSYALLPTPVSAYYLGEVHTELGDEQQAIAYYQQAADSGARDIANQARTKLALLELSHSPHKYVASKAYVGNDGYLWVAVRNNTNIALTDVKVQLTQHSEPGIQSRQDTLGQSLRLDAGQRRDVKTGIGPFQDTRQARQFRSLVISATPAQ
ncbi:MAG: M48 family metalloprotease [Gammaproteobacteria bacterium]|nr:M48 family metalloprotease [Gammaproteobacteria bacterium]